MTDLTRRCSKCGALWIGSQLYWATGKPGRDIDLASLVCGIVPGNNPQCINPCKGQEGGDTWEERRAFLDKAMARVTQQINRLSK